MSVFAISITPFAADGAIDEIAFRRHLRRLAEGGVGVYVGGGGSGEGFTLSDDEARRSLELAVEEIGGTVPVRAMGVEPRTSAEMVRYAGVAKEAGVDAVQIYSLDPGHGHRPTETEVRRYLLDVLDVADVPVVISTHQSVGYRLPSSLLADLLVHYDQIRGVNVTHQDLDYLARVIDVADGRVDVHVGGPGQALTALALGAQGFLTSEANLAPCLCSAVVERYRAGDLAGCFDAFARVIRLSSALYGRGGIRATKAVLNRLGLPGGDVRLPQLPVTDAIVDELMQVVDELDLKGFEGW